MSLLREALGLAGVSDQIRSLLSSRDNAALTMATELPSTALELVTMHSLLDAIHKKDVRMALHTFHAFNCGAQTRAVSRGAKSASQLGEEWTQIMRVMYDLFRLALEVHSPGTIRYMCFHHGTELFVDSQGHFFRDVRHWITVASCVGVKPRTFRAVLVAFLTHAPRADGEDLAQMVVTNVNMRSEPARTIMNRALQEALWVVSKYKG